MEAGCVRHRGADLRRTRTVVGGAEDEGRAHVPGFEVGLNIDREYQ